MKRKTRTCKLLAVLLSLVLWMGMLSVVSIPVSAISCRKDSFLKNYTLTGNMAEDVATIAKSQKGRTGAQFGYTEAWCDEFCADCIENAGADSSIVGHGGYVSDFENVMRKKGAVTVSSPQVGDLVFFTKSHVEIITKVEGGVPYCAGGNNGGTGYYKTNYCAGERRVSSVGTVRLYLRPNYSGSSVTPQENLPIGALDVLECPNSRQIRVAGWAYDYDDLSQSLEVHVYVGGAAGSSTGHCYVINADHGSSDLVANGVSGNHRFDATIDVPDVGEQEVYVYAINIGSGNENPCFGQGTVTIDNSKPIGALDVLECPSAGQIRVAGWAYDCDDLSQSLAIHVYVGGAAGSSTGHCYVINADHKSSDLVANGVSGNHRFDATIDVSEVGEQEVYVYAINVGNGNENPCFGQGSVTIENPEPIGAVDLIDSPEPGKVRLAGWAYDKDDLSQSVDIHVYIGGPAGSDTGHCYDIGYANHGSSDLVANGVTGDHRFDETFDVSEVGEQDVYVYAINIGNGNENPLIASGKVTISAVTTSTTEPETPQALKGDANNDNTVTVADAVMLQKYLLGSGTLTAPENADLYEDDRINGFDLALLKQLLLSNG